VYLYVAVATVTNRDGCGRFRVFEALDCKIKIDYS